MSKVEAAVEGSWTETSGLRVVCILLASATGHKSHQSIKPGHMQRTSDDLQTYRISAK